MLNAIFFDTMSFIIVAIGFLFLGYRIHLLKKELNNYKFKQHADNLIASYSDKVDLESYLLKHGDSLINSHPSFFVRTLVTNYLKLHKQLEQSEVLQISTANESFRIRNIFVAYLAQIYPSGIVKRNIGNSDKNFYHEVFIELPDGTQTSWLVNKDQLNLFENLPVYEKEHDGHTVEMSFHVMEELILSGSLKKPS